MTLTNGTRTQVQALLPHRRQALYVRSYKVVVPGVSALVEIPLHPKAWYFKGHFPRCPVFPGHAALEALAQAAGLAIAAGYRDKDLDIPAGVFAGAGEVRFRNVACPGDTLIVSAVCIKARASICKYACKAEIRRAPGIILPYVEDVEILISLLQS